MATLRADERRKIQMYVEDVAVDFRTLIVRVVEAVTDGQLQLAAYKDERKPDDDISRIINGISGSSN